MIKVGEIFNKYDASDKTEEINKILDLLVKQAFELFNEGYRKLIPPLALMENDELKEDMYIDTASHYISDYIFKLNLKPKINISISEKR